MHYGTSKANVKRWDSDVAKLTEMFHGTYLNPFKLSDLPPELVNFATGVKATPEVQMSLINALDKDDTLAQTFDM